MRMRGLWHVISVMGLLMATHWAVKSARLAFPPSQGTSCLDKWLPQVARGKVCRPKTKKDAPSSDLEWQLKLADTVAAWPFAAGRPHLPQQQRKLRLNPSLQPPFPLPYPLASCHSSAGAMNCICQGIILTNRKSSVIFYDWLIDVDVAPIEREKERARRL